MEKKELRRIIKNRLKNLAGKEKISKSRNICEKLIKTKEWQNAETILIYMSFSNEVITDDIIKTSLKENKKTAVPVIINNKMSFYYIYSIENSFITNQYGIKEPDPDKSETAEINKKTLMIVPGMAFSKNGKRLGRGGGFYDRFMEKHKNLIKIGICYSEQITEDIPMEDFDIKVDKVIYD